MDDWSGDANARDLSRQLRQGQGGHLESRRRAVALELVAMGAMAAISLYQMGLIDHLPEPPLPGLDADQVDAAPDAYRKLNTPDSVLALHSYASTLALAAMGGSDRARKAPWIPLALAAKAVMDAVQAGRLTKKQLSENKGVCSYCLLAAAASFAVVPVVMPEAREAWRRITA